MINNEYVVDAFLNTDIPENTVTFHFDNGNTEILRLSKDGIWANPDVPVDEIARKVFDALEPMITTSYSSELYKKDIQLQTMKNQLDRAERILAALWHPREAVLHATNAKFPFAASMIRAAVAAAEQEVGRE